MRLHASLALCLALFSTSLLASPIENTPTIPKGSNPICKFLRRNFRGSRGAQGTPGFVPTYLFSQSSNEGRHALPYYPSFESTVSCERIYFDGSVVTIPDNGIYMISFNAKTVLDDSSPKKVGIALCVNESVVDETTSENGEIQAQFIRFFGAGEKIQLTIYDIDRSETTFLSFIEMSSLFSDESSPIPNKKLVITRMQ